MVLKDFVVLTPFGRQQLYDLGISMRMKYGYLLKVCPMLYLYYVFSKLGHRTSPKRTPSLCSEQSPSTFINVCTCDSRSTRLARHRMLHSALNFAVGFFGLPLEGQYQQSILIEERGVRIQFLAYPACILF